MEDPSPGTASSTDPPKNSSGESPLNPRGSDDFYELSDVENADLTSINAKTLPSTMFYDDEVDEDDELEMMKQRSLHSFMSFFTSGTGAVFLWLLFFGGLFGAVGGAGYAFKLENPRIEGVASVWIISLLVGSFFTSLAVTRMILHLLLRLISLVHQWDWVHYANELESHISGMIVLVSWLALASIYADKVFLDPAVRPVVQKILAGALLMVVFMAFKSRRMRSLAMSFSYENYRDRIETALQMDRIMGILWKSRHTYKFRKRVRRTNRYGTSRRPSSDAPVQGTSPLSPDHVLKRGSDQDGSCPPAPSSHHKTKSFTTESEKKANFVQFSRLAAKTMGTIPATSDFRLEIGKVARRQAAKLFKYLRPDDRAYLVPSDLQGYLESSSDLGVLMDRIKKNIKYRQTDQSVTPQSGDIVFAERALRKVIQGSLNETVMIVKSMQSMETALNKVDWIFSIVIFMLVGLGWSIMLGNATQLLFAMATFLSGAAFVFSTTARNAFESLIFILFLHPFDVGDRVFINLVTQTIPVASTIPTTMSGSEALDNVLVVEMHLLSTVFERWDGVRLYVPNYVLANKPVYNVRRSGALIEMQRIQISFDTPIARINDLRDRLDKFVRADQTDFTDLSRVNFDAIESCNKIHLNIIAQYQSNWQDLDKQLVFRTRFLMFIKQTLEELGISYLPPVQRISFVGKSGRALPDFPAAELLRQL